MLPRRSSADRRHERSTRRTGNVGVPDLAFMRLDSIGFAGPCMPCCRTTSGSVDVLFVAQRSCSSSNFLPCNFPSRVRKTRRVSPQLRHSETLAYEEGWSRSWPRLYPRSHPRSVLSAQSSWKRQIGVGSRNDDAAFRVSCSVHRNVVRARVPTLANISWNGTGRIAGGRVGRCTEKHGDTQPVKDAEGREGGGHGSWKSTGTRWKKTERDRTILQDACDFPPVDVFAHTARDKGRENDEENHRDVVDSSNVREVDVDRRTERDPGFCRSLVRCHRKEGGKGGGGGAGGRGGGGKGDERKVCCKDDAFRKSLGYRRERCKGRYTARFQEPIANESYERERGLSTHGPTKVSNSCGRKCGFLLVLYLLAWPLVSSTNPSGQFASRFTRSSSLGPAENLSQYNATQFTSLLSSTIVHQQQDQQQQHQHQHQQQEQLHRQLEEMQKAQEQFVRDLAMDENGRRRRRHEDHQEEQNREERKVRESSSPYRDRETVLESETTHPYNEYSWEVNEINPWLSACDLAGPAPADLQGSCGPPEVARNCPISCSVGLNEKGKDAEFHEVMKMIERMKWRAVDGNANANSDNGDDKDTDTDVNNDNDDNNQKKKKKKKKKYNGDNSGKNKEKGEEEFAKDNEMDRVIDETLDSVRVAPEQCLFYLEESHKKDICRDDFGRTSTQSFLTPRENRYWFMSGLRLRHCCEHAVVNALAPGKGGPLENVLNGGQKCVDALDKLLLVDGLAARLHCEFEEVLARYDCAQPYSVIFNCTHCKEAYRKWVCSSLVPYFAHGGPQDSDAMDSWSGSRLRPCRSICQSVEQRCPYLLPGDRAPAYPTQYAGEPTFLCRDPNIPETGEQATRALHSSDEDECCFHACSEETPVSGVCVNCTDRDPRKRGRFADPPTAPHCEINPIQSPQSTGGKHRDAESTDDSLADGEGGDGTSTATAASVSDAVQRLPQGTSLCGSGGVGSMTSVSSADRSTASILPQLFWLFFLLASTLDSVRALPVFRIAGVLVRSIASTGDRKDAGEPGSEGTVRLTGFVARTNDVSACYGAKWLIEKWTACKHRCKSWWCCCWYWWWWRWRRTRLTDTFQWKSRSCSLFIDAASAAAIGVLVEIGLPLRSPPRGSRVSSRLHGCSWRWWWRWWWWCWGCCWWLWRWWWWWWWWKSWRTDRRERMRDRERRVKVNGAEERSEGTRRRDRMESLSKNVCHFPVEEDRLETSSRKHPP